MEREVLEALKDISFKLDVIAARLEALEERVIRVEEPEPEDVEPIVRLRELGEGKLVPFERR